VATLYAGDNQDADFIHEPCLEEAAIDVAAAFKQQPANSEALAELRGGAGGTRSILWQRETVSTFDLALIATNHAAVNYQQLADWCACIVDTRNAMSAVKTKPGQVWKA